MARRLIDHLVPPKRERLPEIIASQIKSLILSEQVKVGDKLPGERELGETLGVSRVVVRSTLSLLEQSGLVEIKPGSSGGAFVTSRWHRPLFNSVYDLFNEGRLTFDHFVEMRKVIECFSVDLAVKRIKPKDIDKLVRLNERLLREAGSTNRAGENHMVFHVTIAEISENPLTLMIVKSLGEMVNILLDLRNPKRSQPLEFYEAVYKSHSSIIEALRCKDAELCKKFMAEDTQFIKTVKY